MRVLLTGIFALLLQQTATAQTALTPAALAPTQLAPTTLAPTTLAPPILKREPHYLAPGVVVYVDSGQCGVGKVMKVTGISKGISRRKTCVALEPQEATLRHVPSL